MSKRPLSEGAAKSKAVLHPGYGYPGIIKEIIYRAAERRQIQSIARSKTLRSALHRPGIRPVARQTI